MAKETSKDLFINFASLWVVYGSVATTLVSMLLNTGMSIRGALGWLVHQIQWWPLEGYNSVLQNTLDLVLSTRPGLAALPYPTDDGVVDAVKVHWAAAAGGSAVARGGDTRAFAPPIPLASPSLTLYGSAFVADANVSGKTGFVRIGYTTTPMDAALWQEIAETWGW